MPSWSTRARTSTNCGGPASNRSSGIRTTRPATTSSSTRTRTSTSRSPACPRSSASPTCTTGKLPEYTVLHRDPLRLAARPRTEVHGTARRWGMSPRSCRRARSSDAFREAGQARAASFACPTWEGSRCRRWRCWRRDSAATIGRINSGSIPATRSFDEWGEGKGVSWLLRGIGSRGWRRMPS